MNQSLVDHAMLESDCTGESSRIEHGTIIVKVRVFNVSTVHSGNLTLVRKFVHCHSHGNVGKRGIGDTDL